MTGAVAFYLPGETELTRLGRLDPDADPQEFQLGYRAWTLQTYLHLAGAGLPVTLVDTLPPRGMVVFHAEHKWEVYRRRRALGDAVLVAMRGDRRATPFADAEIVQNASVAGGRLYAVPHWSQPGLVPRDPARGERLAVVAYKGFLGNLDPAFRSEAWAARLAGLGLEWRLDAAQFQRSLVRNEALDWASFREVDVILAIRPPDARLHLAKPPTKLINAWLAGVPAILGAESAFRALRRSELDYVEASSPEEVVSALQRLQQEPARYRAMVENGRERAAELSRGRLVETWRRLLFETIPADLQRRPARWRSLPLRRLAGALRRLTGRERDR